MENNDSFNDNIVGITFNKPSSWYFLSTGNIQESKRKQILAPESGEMEEEFGMSKDELLEILGDPLCVITKYDPDDSSSQGEFSPTITIQATLKETVLGLWGNETFEDVINSSLDNTSEILEDFTLLKEYGPSNIDGKKSYEFDSSYTFKHEELQNPIKVELKTIKIETSIFFIDINFHSSKEVNEQCEKEFIEFINSISLK